MSNFHVAMLETKIRSLLVEYPELNDDEEFKMNVLEGETDFHRILTSLVRKAQFAGSIATGIAEEARRLGDRKRRYERQEDFNRALIKEVMEIAEIRKAELPLATLVISNKSASVIITDETLLPDNLVRIKREPNKTEIKKALEAGPVAGAELSNGGTTLVIRS
jgi:hypothetical protein